MRMRVLGGYESFGAGICRALADEAKIACWLRVRLLDQRCLQAEIMQRTPGVTWPPWSARRLIGVDWRDHRRPLKPIGDMPSRT